MHHFSLHSLALSQDESQISYYYKLPQKPIIEEDMNIPQLFMFFVSHTSIPQSAFDAVSEIAEHAFYHDFKNVKYKDRFEQTVKKINHKIPHLFDEHMKDVPWSSMKAIVAAIQTNDDGKVTLLMTSAGDMHVIALHKHHGTFIPVDIIKPDSTFSSIISPIKFFSDIIFGDLDIQDKIFITTKNIFDYITLETLQAHILRDLPGMQKKLQALEGNPTPVSIASLIIAQNQPVLHKTIPQKTKPNNIPPPQKPATTSVSKLIQTQVKTAKTIAPAVKDTTAAIAKNIVKGGHTVGKNILRSLQKKKKQVDVDTVEKEAPKAMQLITAFKNHKMLLLGGVLLVGAFIVSGIILQKAADSQKTKGVLAAQLDEINSLLDKAEARIIARDDESALDALVEVQNLLVPLKENTEINDDHITLVEERVETQLTKVRKLDIVESPTKLLSLTAQTVHGVLNTGSTIIVAFDSKVLLIKPAERGTPNFEKELLDGVTINQSTVNDDRDALYLVSQTSLREVAPDGSITDKPHNPSYEAIDTSVYGNGLYALDSSGKIMRHSILDLSVGSSRSWFDSQPSFTNPKSLSIDGDVYVLDQKQIRKFNRGSEQVFSLPTINPPLEDPKSLIVHADDTKLYLHDTLENRIIIIDKGTQNLLKQLSFSTLDPIHAFDVNGTTVTVATSRGLFSAEISL